jgi:hypothetical protein
MGTPCLVNFVKILGALPSDAKSNNVRLDAYKPELPADNTVVRITAFMKSVNMNMLDQSIVIRKFKGWGAELTISAS